MLPVTSQQLAAVLESLGMPDVHSATIRQVYALAAELAKATGETFSHLELGNPGLPSEQVGIEAQCEALRNGCANKYPLINGIPALRQAASAFLKAFFNVEIGPEFITPTVGSMQASFTLQLLLAQRHPGRDAILFLSPGFPAQQHQAKVLGVERRSFDVYNYRGAALEAKLEEMVADGKVTAMLYSNPNNPAWTNFTDEELEIIGRVASRHDIIVIEDLAYLGMDFRTDFSRPGQAPFIPSVARYTDQYILLVSGSKIFSYAGERIAVVCMSPAVYRRRYDFLNSFYDMPAFGDAYIFGVLYTASSGTSHSAQHALAAMMQAAVDGKLDFVGHTREYARRAALMKQAFADNGFHLVYDHDGESPLADGFFFTVGYPGLTGQELQEQLLLHGVATIHLASTGSGQDGVRVTCSTMNTPADIATLRSHLSRFAAAHPQPGKPAAAHKPESCLIS